MMRYRHARTALTARPGRSASQPPETGQSQLEFNFEQAAAPEASSTPTSVDRPLIRFALRFAQLLETDPAAAFDNPATAELAREIFGSAAGHAREAYDTAEAGFNLYLRTLSLDLTNPPAALEQLQREQRRLPTQSRRDQTQIDFQQFSTPPAEALLVILAAAICSEMEVLEPSAGTGNLATLARLAGAQVDTNELDPRRRELLALLGFQPTAYDAERLDNLLPGDRYYDAVVMNPPFSATAGRVAGHSTAFGARHVEQALLRLRPGGRLVALVGAGMALDRPGAQDWWTRIAARYRLRANLGIDGQVYAKFGTTYDHQLIVIDHAGQTKAPADVITGAGLSLMAAWEQIKPLSKEDVYGRIRAADRTTGGGDATTATGYRTATVRLADRGASDAPVGGRSGGNQCAADDAGHDRRLAALESVGARTTERTPANGEDDSRARTPDVAERRGGASPLGGLFTVGGARRLASDVGELDTSAAPQAVDFEAGAVFAPYRVQKAVVRGALAHPANVVESAAMACVEPPDVTYRHQLPAEVIAEGRVSNLQLEDVIYAGQATSVLLPDGMRKGHWNGDGTGIGKGREIYAFIYNELVQGRMKHVHLSAAHQLAADAERDRDALGLPLPLLQQASFQVDEPILATSGVLFTTYTLVSNDFDGDQRRFKQLTEWLGADFDGVIAFDEAHLMKNAAATPHGAKATIDQGTLRGNMGIALQRMFPQARVRYFSATGATEARHLAPYERLGLWGAGAPFADFAAFLVAMERGGVAAMEMLCRDLKSVGTYLSRTISYGPTRRADGSIVPQSAVEYEPLLHRLTAEESRQYDQIADLWAELLVAFESAERSAGQRRSGSRYAQFYSAQQRFFLQLMMAYALPDVIPAIERDLRAGRSVVLSLFNTGEAQTDRKVQDARAQGIELSELDATPREMIVQLIEKQFPLHQYEEQTDPVTGNVVRVRVNDVAGNPEINRENHRRQQALLDQVADLDIPQNPLDALVAHFGVEAVAEISGRSHRFEHGKYVRRKLQGVPRQKLNEFETRLFQQGKKRIAVLSGAGSTGISVHAELDARNQDRRVFYAFQLSWSADQQMQAFGRVHRSNQSSAPVIRLVLLDLAGQRRLVNAVSKRLAALGALTKGERHSLSSDLFRVEDVTDEYGKSALGRLYREMERGRFHEESLGLRTLERMGLLNQEKTAVRESYTAHVEQFLNRIMVLPVQAQNRLFELFYERYLEAVEAAKRQSAFDFGVEEICARNLRRVAAPQTLYTDTSSGARTLLHELEGDVDVVRHSVESALAHAKLGFYRNLRSERIYAVAPHGDPERRELYLTGVKGPRKALEPEELEQKYERVELSVARLWWEAEYAGTPATEPKRFHILSGAIFPIYDKIMGSSGIQCVKIARAVLTDGQALVGLNLSPADVPNVKQRLGIGTPLGQATAAEISALLAGGALIELDNGWRLTQARIAGDEVVELVLHGIAGNRQELAAYGFVEEIMHFKRRWFVLEDGATPVLARLLERRRPVRDLSRAEGVQG